MKDRVRLVVLFGGRSAEHEVSCTSAVSVLQALDPERYEIVPIGVTRQGTWVLAEEAAKALAAGGPKALPAALTAEGPYVGPLAAPGEGTPSEPYHSPPLPYCPLAAAATAQR